jgi:hypothetical protein
MQRRQSTRLRNRVTTARAQRIANYLRALDKQNAGQPRCSLCLVAQTDSTNNIIYDLILLRESGFWRDEENEIGPPPDGYRIIVKNQHPESSADSTGLVVEANSSSDDRSTRGADNLSTSRDANDTRISVTSSNNLTYDNDSSNINESRETGSWRTGTDSVDSLASS